VQLRLFHNELFALTIMSGAKRVPKLIDHGYAETGELPFIMMEKLGPTVEAYVNVPEYSRFTHYSALMTVYLMVRCLEEIHNYNLVSGDVKLANFCMIVKKNQPIGVKIIDFALSQQFGPHSFEDLPPRSAKGYNRFPGTVPFASRAAHYKLDLCPYDDLESLLYAIARLFGCQLPWDIHYGTAAEPVLKKKHTFWTETQYNFYRPLNEIFKFIRDLNRRDLVPYDDLKALIRNEMVKLPEHDDCYPMIRKKDCRNYHVLI